MAKALTSSRGELNAYAPRIETIQVPKDKIREVIGTGGKVVREIVEKTGAKIDIGDDGTIKVSASVPAPWRTPTKWPPARLTMRT